MKRRIVILIALALTASACVTVDEGEAVVPVRFGESLEPITAPGLHYFNFITADAVSFPVRPEELTFSAGDTTQAPISALSSEGGEVRIDLTALVRIDGEQARTVYERAGNSWASVKQNIVVPTVRSVVRDCIPKFDFEEARTSKRGEAQLCVLEGLQDVLNPRGIIVEEVLIREMQANEALQSSIEQRLEAQNAVREAEFLQQQAIVEARTAVIEAEGRRDAAIVDAEGIAEANRLVAESLTDNILELRIVESLGDKAVYFFGNSTGGVNPRIDLPVGE